MHDSITWYPELASSVASGRSSKRGATRAGGFFERRTLFLDCTGSMSAKSWPFVGAFSALMAMSVVSEFSLGVDAEDDCCVFTFAVVERGVVDRDKGSSLTALTRVELISAAKSLSAEVSRLTSIVSASGD